MGRHFGSVSLACGLLAVSACFENGGPRLPVPTELEYLESVAFEQSGDHLKAEVPGFVTYRPTCNGGSIRHYFELGPTGSVDFVVTSAEGIRPGPGESRAFTLEHDRNANDQAWQFTMKQADGALERLHHSYYRFTESATPVPIEDEIGNGSQASPGGNASWARRWGPGRVAGSYRLYLNTGTLPSGFSASLSFAARASVRHCPPN